MTALFSSAGNGNSAGLRLRGGLKTIHLLGTFDSASVDFQISLDAGSNYADIPGEANAITAEKVFNVQIPDGAYLRAAISGGGGSVSLSANSLP